MKKELKKKSSKIQPPFHHPRLLEHDKVCAIKCQHLPVNPLCLELSLRKVWVTILGELHIRYLGKQTTAVFYFFFWNLNLIY